MPFILPSVYPITDRCITGLSHAEQTRRLIAGGAKIVQIREKSAPVGDWIDDARDAVRMCREAGIACIINDRVDVARLLGADGVHLGQDDILPVDARGILGTDAVIGYSTHDLDQLNKAIAEPVNYIAFGPVYATGTKERPDPVVGLEMLATAVVMAADRPLVAIGGITRENAAAVKDTGVTSIAVISDVLSEPARITKRIRDLSRLVDQR